MAKDTRIAFRTSAELKRRAQAAAKKVHLDETTLAEQSLQAVVEYIEQHGGIWLPLKVVPDPEQPFSEAGERSVSAGGPSTLSTARYPRETPEPTSLVLNEDPAPPRAPKRPSKKR